MYTVANLAKEAKVTADAVRHYVKLGLLHPRRHVENGYKLFSKNDIIRVQFIRKAKSLGFTLREISEIFSHSNNVNSPCPRIHALLKHYIESNRERLEELKTLQECMENALQQWNSMPENPPNGASVCRLIESFSEARENILHAEEM